ncbi:MAG: hypothetical protein AAF718_17520, partial [Pseudomonadota bacterium]
QFTLSQRIGRKNRRSSKRKYRGFAGQFHVTFSLRHTLLKNSTYTFINPPQPFPNKNTQNSLEERRGFL